MEIVVVMSKCR